MNMRNAYIQAIILVIVIIIIVVLLSSCSRSSDSIYVAAISNKIDQNTDKIGQNTKQLKEEIKNTNNLLIVEIQKTNNLLKRMLKCNQWITMGIAPYTFRSVLVCPDSKNLAKIEPKIEYQ